MSDVRIGLESLFSMELRWDEAHGFDFEGPFGRRNFQRVLAGGSVTGPRFSGKVVEVSTTDWGRKSADGSIRELEAWVTIQADDEAVALLQVRGRMSPRYGDGQSRLQIMIHAPGDGPYDSLNRRQAFGIGRTEKGVHTVDVYAIGDVLDDGSKPAEGLETISAELVLVRKSEHNPNLKHHVIQNQLGGRYLSVADGGGAFQGPRFSGDFVRGFSWTPHKYSMKDDVLLMHYDADTLVADDQGVPLLMSYTGVTAPGQYPDRSWRTCLLFETPIDGPHAWLNEAVGIGVGRWMGDGAQYHVYAVR